jgi:hypothetical protein
LDVVTTLSSPLLLYKTKTQFSAFFVATQFFYTLSFINILIAIILVIMYLLFIQDQYRVVVLRWIGIDLVVAGTWNLRPTIF